MAKQTNGELVVVTSGFDYAALGDAAEQVRTSTEKIRKILHKTIEDIIEVGTELLAVKEALPHGQFGKWLAAEFGWRERSAENFMSVALRFGGKSAKIAELKIQPSAAYLLAAPSVPDEARVAAIERAECGEDITSTVAKEIISETRKREKKQVKPVPADKLGERLIKTLERYKEKWNPRELAGLARQLREFADALDQKSASKRPKKG